MKDKEELIKRYFYGSSASQNRGWGGIVWNYVRIILLVKIRITKQLYYVDLIINYLKKMSVGIFDRAYMGIHI